MSNQWKSLAAAAALVFVGTAHASPLPLEGRTLTGDRVDAYNPGAVMIYDPNLNITWLRDWNVNGERTWQDQITWAASLHVCAFANWSLPTSLNQDGSGPCERFDCTGSPMGYMYYVELGNVANGGMTNVGPFQNVLTTRVYWSSTEYAHVTSYAWAFGTFDGIQAFDQKTFAFAAAAVRPGDVAAAIPEPETYALMIAGLAAVGFAARRRRRA